MANANPALNSTAQCQSNLELEVDETGVSIGYAAQDDEGDGDDFEYRCQDWVASGSSVIGKFNEEKGD